MEYCPHCQRWVEPTKGSADLVAGHLFGRLGSLIGAGHYLLKGLRCPICNNVIKGRGAGQYVPAQAQAPIQQQSSPQQQSPYYPPSEPAPQPSPVITPRAVLGQLASEIVGLERTAGGRILISLDSVSIKEAMALVLFAHYSKPLSDSELETELNYSWRATTESEVSTARLDLHVERLKFVTGGKHVLTAAGIQWVRSQILPRFNPQKAFEDTLRRELGGRLEIISQPGQLILKPKRYLDTKEHNDTFNLVSKIAREHGWRGSWTDRGFIVTKFQ